MLQSRSRNLLVVGRHTPYADEVKAYRERLEKNANILQKKLDEALSSVK